MKKMIKVLGVGILVLLGLLILLISASTINHNYQLRNEAQLYPAPGKLVEVNNNLIHVFTEGQGDITLVFLSGLGTSSPTIDFKRLWMRLIDEYEIVVVERPGYGWSDVTSTPRDIDTMLEETRKALELSEINGPYILVPHSMSGLIALYWAQNYPDEVKGIIGLDPTVPNYVKHFYDKSEKTNFYFMYFISRIGLSRFMPISDVEDMFPLMKSDELSEEDKAQFLSLFYKSTYTKNMLNEFDYLPHNANKIMSNELPVDTPIYFFISLEQNDSYPDSKEFLTDYIYDFNFGKYTYLEAGHYIHNEEPDLIANEMKRFIENLVK